MHYFEYRKNILHAEDISLVALSEAVGTPFYCYSSATLERHYKVFAKAFANKDALICYAIKANSNLAVIKTLADLGAGMDVVSEGEIRRARSVGVPAEKIVFAGVGKTRDEMAYALAEGIYTFNIESEPELIVLNEIAAGLGLTARVTIRINPDVDPKTHEKISTGKAENKFGIPYQNAQKIYARASKLKNIEASGIHMHIGSQITDLAPFKDAFTLLRELTLTLRADGIKITHLDLGGGLGVPYEADKEVPPHPDDYARIVDETLGDLDCRLVMEPGRMITANAGILVSKVIYTKPGQDKSFMIVDGAMNDLIRPTLYSAHHDILPVNKTRMKRKLKRTDVVGPVCETGDYFAQNRELPPLDPDDLIAVMTAGAYGAVQSGTYNSRLMIPEVLVKGDQYAVIRPRQTYEELLGLDRVPEWQ
ncbi:MAG: diaminopimelate decarboxylase [Methyloligellaceae bacterium]